MGYGLLHAGMHVPRIPFVRMSFSDRADSRPLRAVLPPVLQHHPDSPFPNLRGNQGGSVQISSQQLGEGPTQRLVFAVTGLGFSINVNNPPR